MAKPFRCRLGIAQILANPAYADELVASLQEPAFPDGNERIGLFTIAGLERINSLRQKIAEEYIQHLNRKLDAILRFAASAGVELLIFPEYSIPAESLPACKSLSDELKVSVVAGSHVVTLNDAAQEAYRDLGFQWDSGRPKELDERVRRAISIVFVPGQSPMAFTKYVRSKWETCLEPGSPAFHGFELKGRAGKFEVQVLICLEALTEQPAVKEKHTHPRLIAIPAFTPTSDDFYDFARLSLLQGKCTLFANVGDLGGSKAFARAERAGFWFTEKDGSGRIPHHAEALLVIEADLEKQFEIRKSSIEHTTVSDVRVFPLLYEMNSAESKQYIELLGFASSGVLTLGELKNRLDPFTNLTGRVFPRFLQDKLRHLVSHVLPAGTVNIEQALDWMKPVVVSDTPSTDVLRWDLCSRSIDAVNELLVSGSFVAETKQLLDVYAHLMKKRNELAEFVRAEDKPEQTVSKPQLLLPQSAAIETPFFDRDQVFDRIRAFITQSSDAAFVLSGMRGIGKTSLTLEAFRQAMPRTKRIWLQLTEGISYERLLAELAYACNLQIADTSDLASSQERIELRIISSLSQASSAVVVLDEFQYLLLQSGEIENPLVRKFLLTLLGASSKSRTKFIFISNIIPRLGPDFDTYCSPFSLQGLANEYSKRLLQHWFQFGRETRSGNLPIPSEKFLSVLGGHPLAVKVAARLWAQHPSRDLVDDISIYKELRDTIVVFILEKLKVSPVESELLSFASIFRLPAPREAFLRWRGEEANYLLNSLASQYLVESSELGYQLHPLVRDFYYHDLSSESAQTFHRIAGKFYIELFEKVRNTTKQLNPEFLGEAIHHFLAAGDKRRVQDFSFYRHELKPVALAHYRRHEFKMALADYRVLVELDPSDADSHLHLALIYAREKRWVDAEMHYEKAIDLRPGAYWILQAYGSAKLNAGRLAEAEDLLTRAEQANPDNSSTLIEIGRLREKQSDLLDAEYYFKRAVEVDRNNSFAHYNLAKLLYRTGDFAQAYQSAISALASRPLDQRNKDLVRELKEKVTKSQAGQDEKAIKA